MTGGNRYAKAGSGQTGVRVILLVFCLVLVTGCSHHQPAPVEEHSNTQLKRQLNSNGSYSVRSGDTLYAIAFNFDVDARKLAQWNGISSPYIIYPGQKLQLSAPPRSRGSTPGVQITALKSPRQSTTKTKSSPAKATPAKSKTVPATSSKVATSSKGQIYAADPKNWTWPTNGRVLRAYVAGNPARNGLDIAGKEGQDILASAGGQVVYSGNGLIGYGELIIIKHSERMLSAYAHNRVRLVKEGEQVSRGQKIAEMGRNAGNEQLLHFEIRARGKPVNPLTYLPRK